MIEDTIKHVLSFLKPSEQLGIFEDNDNFIRQDACVKLVSVFRKYTKNKKAYWETVKLWRYNRIHLTKFMLTKFNKFVSPQKMTDLQKMRMLVKISNSR